MENLIAGENIKIVYDEVGKQIVISAPIVNKTNLKHGVFLVSGNVIEVVAGKNIEISTATPNTIKFSANIDKEIARIVDLEGRIINLEKVITSLLREKK